MSSPQIKVTDFKIPLKEIVEATNNFENLIGEGAFGKVYKGSLSLTGKQIDIAARRLHGDYGQGDLEFWWEISMLALSGLKHDNLVSFVGYCDEDGMKIIITKYEANKSLQHHLENSNLKWMQRLQICVGIARGLSYIHYDDGHDLSVIHRNIKSSKILLDENWKPKLSGFGISMKNTKARRHRLLLAEVIGTIGYVDPIYEKTGFVTHKSDVFSFGVLLFEVLCQRRALKIDELEQHSPQFFKYDHKEGTFDVAGEVDEIADTDGKLTNSNNIHKPYNTPSFNGGYRHSASFVDKQPSSFASSFNGGNRQSASFVDKQPTSFALSFNDDYRQSASFVDKQPTSFASSFNDGYRQSASFVEKQPTSFASSFNDGYRQSASLVDKQPSSFNDPRSPGPFVHLNYSFTGRAPISTDSDDPLSPSDFVGLSLVGRKFQQIWTPSTVNVPKPSPSNETTPAYITMPSPATIMTPSPTSIPTPSQVNVTMTSPIKEPTPVYVATSSAAIITTPPTSVTTPSPVNVPVASPANEPAPGCVATPSPADDQLQIKSDYSTDQEFELHPLYTMKKLEQYIHSPNEELLAQLVKYHYDDLENILDLEDMIDPALKEQMDLKSLQIFSETAFSCLKEQRSQRPNIDHILRNLEIALAHQIKRENPEHSLIPGEVEGTLSSSKRLEAGNLDHLKIPLSEIERATKKFTQKYLGSGTYGKVYRADLELPLEGNDKGEIPQKRTVAIKCIRDDKHGKEGFIAEIELLTSCKHPNIVSLLGFCDEGPNMILVYEHASNKSLDNYLGSTNNSINITWVQRIKICIDIARGLHYLHNKVEDEHRIIHRDIKSGNILLGRNWVAQIADFGLSRFHQVNQQGKTLYTGTIAGTKEYLCPEYMKTGRLKRAVDIYSLGVVLFEVLSGKLANDQVYVVENDIGIAHVARRRFEDRTINEMVDLKIMDEVDELTSTINKGPNQDSLKTFIEIAHQCLAKTQDKRPTAKDIIEELEKALLFQEKNKDKLQMSFEEIESATEKFSRKNLIGGGGFGLVYRGEVPHANGSKTIVAKRMDKSQGQGEHHFLTELEILFEYKHDNIIGLEGYCNEKDEKIIVYEHASKRSLERHLNKDSLTWTKRLKICIDVACGLAFLHRGAQTNEMVIHRDIKCANILLNGDWKAKISDFGLSSITTINQEDISNLVGTNGYLDPVYEITGFFTEKSDIYSFGVVLFEILYGRLLAPDSKNYDKIRVDAILKDIHEEEKLDFIVFKHIKGQIALESLSTFRKIVSQCLQFNRTNRPRAEEVLQQLKMALKFQEEYEIWQPKLPNDYKEIIQMSKSPETYTTKNNKELYNIFSNGILLPEDKLWFSLGNNGERNLMISARKFSYKNRPLHKLRSIRQSRFQKVAKMLDISNLKIQVQIKTRFLSPDVNYGVYLVFKFCELNPNPCKPMYVNLTYKMKSEKLHAYFATSRDQEWMMIELHQFLNDKEDNEFAFLLESFSRYYCRSDAIYVEGIEFRVMDKVKEKENDQLQQVQTFLESKSNIEQLLTDYDEIIKRSRQSDRNSSKQGLYYLLKYYSILIDDDEKLFSINKMNGKKCHMLPAKAVLYDSSNERLFTWKDSSDSRFQKVVELISQPVFRIKCKIESQLLSLNTKYVCYLVFKLSEKCRGLHCPVRVRDLLHRKNKEIEILYFRSPSPSNLHDKFRVPEQRQDGWMEVNVWEFNPDNELTKSHVPMDLKLISYQGTMCGLIVYGLEFRPM